MTTREEEKPPTCALIIGHPGHELCVLEWVHKVRPLVVVLTDGSGRDGRPRTAMTARLLQSAGARLCGAFEVSSDQAIYRAMLGVDHSFFCSLGDRLAALLATENIDCVAGDAVEGMNPTHDLCRVLIDRAVRDAERMTGRRIRNYGFPLYGRPRSASTSPRAWCLTLSAAELSQKLASMRDYARAIGGTLESDIEKAFREYGEASFGEEALDVVDTRERLSRFATEPPFYESHGEQRVAAGHYRKVIRFNEHIAPIVRALIPTADT